MVREWNGDDRYELDINTGYVKKVASGNTLWRDMFLPVGFPQTVTDDYFIFQIWDTLQAVSSYLRGILSTQALLVGVGVGDAAATSTSAVIQWVFRDGCSMIGGMLFAYGYATCFMSDLKRWRLFADYINDVGMTLELLAPTLPSGLFLLFACLGSICKAACGVAAGASRAAILQHFSQNPNSSITDLSAKEGIQETAVNLIGLILGMSFTSFIDADPYYTWVAFISLTLFHIYANYKAVSCLVLNSLSLRRLWILARQFTENEKVLTPLEVSRLEDVFAFPVLKTRSCIMTALDESHSIQLGYPLHEMVITPDLKQQIQDDMGGMYIIEANRHCSSFKVAIHVKATAADIILCVLDICALVSGGVVRLDNEDAVNLFVDLLEQRGWKTNSVIFDSKGWLCDW